MARSRLKLSACTCVAVALTATTLGPRLAGAQSEPSPTPSADGELADSDLADSNMIDPLAAQVEQPLHEDRSAVQSALGSEQRRVVPDYDGRGEAPLTAEDILLSPPRIALLPLYLLSDIFLRAPLSVLFSSLEKYHVIEWYAFLTTWDHGNGGVVPQFGLESGFSPSVGLATHWDNLIGDFFDIGLSGSTDFARTWHVGAKLRTRFLADRLRIEAGFDDDGQGDFVFYGVGPKHGDADESRFQRHKTMGSLRVELTPESAGFGGWALFEVSSFSFGCASPDNSNSNSFPNDLCGADNQIGTTDDLHRVLQPSRIDYIATGYLISRLKLKAYFDSRERRPASGTGVRVEAHGRWGQGLDDHSAPIGFLRYGGEIAGFWDIIPGYQRILALRLYIEAVGVINNGDVPFSELIPLGGNEVMRGFFNHRLHGFTAITSSLEYRYPIWSFIEAQLFYEVGNVFGRDFRGIAGQRLRSSFGIALRSIESRHTSFQAGLAFGTSQFNAPRFAVESVRIYFGTNWGF